MPTAPSLPWGAKRSANGHPNRSTVKYVQIGNENWHKPFHDNYIKIYTAIKQQSPEAPGDLGRRLDWE